MPGKPVVLITGCSSGFGLETAREVFETNTLGTIATTQAVLPLFRERKGRGRRQCHPECDLDAASLALRLHGQQNGCERLHRILARELKPFQVGVSLVRPGRAPETSFGDNARSRMPGGIHDAYADLAKTIFEELGKSSAVTRPLDAAQAVGRGRPIPPARSVLPRGPTLWRWRGRPQTEVPIPNKRVAPVTGANQGVGLPVAKELVAHGLTVLVGSRNFERGEAAAKVRVALLGPDDPSGTFTRWENVNIPW